MNARTTISGFLIGAAVVAAIGVGAVAWLRIDPSGQGGNRLPEAFDYDLEKYEKIDPDLVKYRQVMQIPVEMREARAVAVGPEDRVFVAGDKSICIFAPDGGKLSPVLLDQEPYCLTVGGGEHRFPGRIYAGMRDHVEVFAADGKRESVWDHVPGKRATLTSLAAAEEDIFAADAGALVVWHYNLDGKLLGGIGKHNPDRGIQGFVVPSPYFDLAVAPDGLLRVANPGTSHRSLHLRRPPGAFLGQARIGRRCVLRLLQPVEHRHPRRRPGRHGRKGHPAGENLQRVGPVRVRRRRPRRLGPEPRVVGRNPR